VFVVFNTSSSTQALTNRSTIVPAGSKIVNLLDTSEVLTITEGRETPRITVPGTTAKIFVAQGDWRPLDPVVISSSPAHDAAGMPASCPIVLQFSEPMNTGIVQSALSTLPPVEGSFHWSAKSDAVTFTPIGAGFPTGTNVLVRVNNSAAAAGSGRPMFAPYELRFSTGGN
jgi:hypothetical protein